MTAMHRILWLPNDAEERHVSWDDVSPSSVRNPSGIRIDSETALQSTVVLACARVLAESIASLPLHVYERITSGGRRLATSHPLYRRLHVAPNSWQTSFEWREQQVLWMCLWGNSYNLLVPGASGFATELWPLHPSRMKPERVENGRIRYKYRDEAGREETYTQDQIMHVRWSSDDGIEGMVPVELARDAIGLARACEIHGARYFGNGARPGFVLTTDNDMKPEAAAMLRDNWERMHRGADRASRTAVLFGGLKPMEIAGSNNQESQFLETRRFQIEEICRLYRVPPHLVGDLTRSSFSNIEQQSIDFVQHTLLPWLRRFENAFTRDLITEDDRYFAEFDTRGLLRGDAAARASYYNTLSLLGVVSVNEIRSWENLDPIEDGDVRFVQLNMQTLEQANVASAAAAAPPPTQAEPAGLEPTTDVPAVAEPEAEAGPQIADVSLNGAQVSSLLEIVTQYNAGLLNEAGAKAIIAAAFPGVPTATVNAIISGTNTTPVAATGDEPPPPVASRAMTISIDYDRTFSESPQLWGEFARQSAATGNTVVMVSRRPDTQENQDEVAAAIGDYREAFSRVLLVGDRLKDEAAREAGLAVDVWVDDSPQFIRSSEHRAAPDAVDTGDYVSWGSGDGRGRGRITRVVRDGEINVPDSSFTITGTKEDPAALIRVYRKSADGWSASDRLVGHRLSTLTKIDPL